MRYRDHRRPHLGPEVLAQAEFCCPRRQRFATSSAGLKTFGSFPSCAGYRDDLWHSRILLPGLQTFRAFAAELSRIAAFSFRRETRHVLPSCFHAGPGHRIEGRNPWRLQLFPPSAPRGDPFFGVSFVRFRYGPSGCSPPGLITTLGTHCLRGRPEALHPGFQPPGHPKRLPDVTTAPNWELRRQDSHPLAQQLASLRSLHGVPWGGFPRFLGTMECSDSWPPFPPRFVSFAWRYRACARPSLPGTASAPLPGLGCSTGCPSRFFRTETIRPPRFLRSPPVCMPRSPTPASSSRPAFCGVSMRPSVKLTTSALAGIISRGSITRPAHSLCPLRSADHSATTQHSVPAGGQPLPGGTGYPLGSTERFPRSRLHLFPLSQASPGALVRITR